MANIQQYQLYHTQQIEMLGWTAEQAQFFTAFRNDFDNLNLDLTDLENQVAQNTTNIETNTLNIATNTSNIATNTTNISTNTTNIATNTSDIATNATNISTNTGNISTNTTNISTNTTNLTNHIAATEAHGSTGDIIGTGDAAESATRGAVFLADAVTDASQSTVAVTQPDVPSAAPTYSVADTQTNAVLTNELKADVNQLVSDVNDAIDQLNELMANLRTSGVLDT